MVRMIELFVPLKRIDESLPEPVYASSGAVAFDLYTRVETPISSGALARIPLNVILRVPDGYGLFLTLRSSVPERYGLLMPHGAGVIDQDYCGPEDELVAQVWNFRPDPVVVPKGARIVQGSLVRVARADWVECAFSPSRGGFGSTGV